MHDVEVIDKDNELVLKCSCGWNSIATEAIFAKAIKERHETLTKIPNELGD